jgi:hypothetical protein
VGVMLRAKTAVLTSRVMGVDESTKLAIYRGWSSLRLALLLRGVPKPPQTFR